MAGADEASLIGEDHRLDPVAQAELGQDPADVGLDRAFAEIEPGGDAPVGQAARDEPEHLALPFGQDVEALVLSALGGLSGVLAGTLVTVGVARWYGWSPLIPPPAVWGGFAAAVLVGAAAGLYPSLRAARLAPTDALRST